MDVDAVLLSVQERDKWRHRLGLLKQSLGAVREDRRRWQHRLRRLEGELRRLAEYSEAFVDRMQGTPRSRTDGTTNSGPVPR